MIAPASFASTPSESAPEAGPRRRRIPVRPHEVPPRAALVLLVLVTLLAVGVRWHNLTTWSFWDDEVYTIRDAYAITDELYDNPEYPISFVVARAAMNLWGVNHFSVRFFPFLFGALTVPMLYLLSYRYFGRNAALLGALFLALSHWHLYQSQNARGYTLLLLLGTLAIWLYFLGLERNRPWMWISAWVLLIAAFYTQYVAAFVGIIFVLYPAALLLLRYSLPPGATRAFWIVYVLLLLFGAATSVPILWEIASRLDAGQYSFGRSIRGPVGTVAAIAWRVTIPLFVLGLAGVGDLLRPKLAGELLDRRERAGIYFGLVIVVPMAALMFLSIVMPAWPRYALFILPALCLLAGIFVTRKTIEPKRWVLGGTLLLAVIGPMLLEVGAYNTYEVRHGNRPNFRDAYRTIEPMIEPGDLIAPAVPAMAIYYLGDESKPYFQVLRAAENREKHQVFYGYGIHTKSGVPYANVKLEGLDAHEFRWVKDQNRRTWFIVSDYIWLDALRRNLDPDVEMITYERSTNGFTDHSVWVFRWTPDDWAPDTRSTDQWRFDDWREDE